MDAVGEGRRGEGRLQQAMDEDIAEGIEIDAAGEGRREQLRTTRKDSKLITTTLYDL